MEFSPTSTMDTTYTNCGPDGERSMSLEWKKARPPPEGRALTRGSKLSRENMMPPVPKKRQLLDAARSVYVNNYCLNGTDTSDKVVRDSVNEHQNVIKEQHRKMDPHSNPSKNDAPKTKDAMVDTSNNFNPGISSSSGETSQDHRSNAPQDNEHIYQTPVKHSRPNFRKSPSPKSDKESDSIINKEGEVGRIGRSSVKSLSSSTSSLSGASSSASFDGGERKEHGDPMYENLPKSDPEKANVKNNSNNNSNSSSSISNKSNSSNDKKNNCKKSRSNSEENEISYERDVVVYEAITLGNDTIIYDKNNTSGSDGSNKSKESKNSKKNGKSGDEGPSVKQSVQLYENLVNNGEKRDENESSEKEKHSDGNENSKTILSGLISGLNKSSKSAAQNGNHNLNSKEKSTNKSEDVTEKEVEAVMNGLENILRSAESSVSLASMGTVKENPLLKENFEDRASPEQPVNEIEIVPTRVPQIPPRSRSRGTSSQSSRSRTPDPALYFDSPSETSDTDNFQCKDGDSFNPLSVESSKSFGWVKGDPGLRRRDTFNERPSDKNNFRNHGLRRCESVNINNLKEYNSHRSYSPRRRGSNELVPLEENEVQISGRRYTQYTPAEVEHQNRINNEMSSDMKRRRNRSFDDRLDRWLDDDLHRQQQQHQQKYPHAPQQEYRRHSRSSSRSREKRNPPPPKPSRNSKTHFSQNEAFNGFINPTTGLRESDYGPNFILNSPPNPHKLEEVLSDLVDHRGKSRNGRISRKKLLIDDPAIPTPDYSATPAGTLTNDKISSGGRHILEIASGLY